MNKLLKVCGLALFMGLFKGIIGFENLVISLLLVILVFKE